MDRKLRQLSLLKKLHALMIELSLECEKDDNFNELVAKLDIVSRSIDEIELDLKKYE